MPKSDGIPPPVDDGQQPPTEENLALIPCSDTVEYRLRADGQWQRWTNGGGFWTFANVDESDVPEDCK